MLLFSFMCKYEIDQKIQTLYLVVGGVNYFNKDLFSFKHMNSKLLAESKAIVNRCSFHSFTIYNMSFIRHHLCMLDRILHHIPYRQPPNQTYHIRTS